MLFLILLYNKNRRSQIGDVDSTGIMECFLFFFPKFYIHDDGELKPASLQIYQEVLSKFLSSGGRMLKFGSSRSSYNL